MIPYSDSPTPRRIHFPYVMIGLLLLNVLVFLFELSLGPREADQFIQEFGVVPYKITRGTTISPEIGLPVFVTLFTAMFLHGGWLHLIGNMLFLWVFGDNVEDRLGPVLFLLFYLFAGLAASLTHIFFSFSSTLPSIGASGAIAGVLAAYLILFPRAPVRTLILFFPLRLPALVIIGAWIVLQFLNAVAALGADTAQPSGIAFWAHVGGFAAGFVMILTLKLMGVVETRPTSRRI